MVRKKFFMNKKRHPITQEIPRLSGTPCQELGTKAKYVCILLYHNKIYALVVLAVLWEKKHNKNRHNK